MSRNNKTPRYAVRLLVLLAVFAVVFFGGLRLFVPEGSKLTGSYDAGTLPYVAAQPVSYHGAESCGATGCHETVVKKWSEGAHGARKEQSKCEVCHGPQGDHPTKVKKLPKVRGDGDIALLCLNCHRQLKARATTAQPQIDPATHPFPHKGILVCTQCHDPHSPALGAPKPAAVKDKKAEKPAEKSGVSESAKPCFGCHGAGGRGGFAPQLAGQPAKALKEKLTKFKTGATKGTMMNAIAAGLKDADIDALAQFFSKQ